MDEQSKDAQSYLAALEKALKSLPKPERDDALAFYQEYLDEAGSQGFAAAQAALGTPKVLAAQIKADLAMKSIGGEVQVQPLAPLAGAAAAASGQAPGAQPGYAQPGYTQAAYGQPGAFVQGFGQPAKQSSGLKVALLVLLAILALPIGLPLAIVVVALFIVVMAVLASVVIAIGAITVALFAYGLVSTVCSVILLFSSFPVGLFYLGAGLASLGLSLLMVLATIAVAKATGKALAYIFNAIRRRLSNSKPAQQPPAPAQYAPGNQYAPAQYTPGTNNEGGEQ